MNKPNAAYLRSPTIGLGSINDDDDMSQAVAAEAAAGRAIADEIATLKARIAELEARQIKLRWQGDFAYVGQLRVGRVFHNASSKTIWFVSAAEGQADTIAAAKVAAEAAAIKMLTEPGS
jgi:hypothetical protein